MPNIEMNKETKIYFIGRKQGVGLRRYRLSHLENRRRFEPEGLKDAKDKIKQTRFIQNADVIWVRVRPEHTKDKQRYLIEERLKNIRGKKPIINDISIFDNYDCKDITFDLWSNAGVTCPSYIKINAKEGKHNISQEVEKIHTFISIHGKMFLRTNNETAANGMFLLNKDSTKIEIEYALKSLIQRCESFHNTRRATNIVGVKFISSESGSGFQDLYRVHVLFGKILSYYAVTSHLDIFHNIDMGGNDLDRFIELNRDLCERMSKIKQNVLKAAKVLNCNLGAVEFFIQNNELIFLELNPMWGGHASKFGFGNDKMQAYLKENRDQLIKLIPNIYTFMDRQTYYKDLFQWIHYYCSTNL